MVEFEKCPNCRVSIGEKHKVDCDVGRCKTHGNQRLFCTGSGICAETKFSGYWPGTEEAIERGWFAIQVEGREWVPCHADEPNSIPDVNKVIRTLEWNPDTEKYE
jgi:hypothetical protein